MCRSVTDLLTKMMQMILTVDDTKHLYEHCDFGNCRGFLYSVAGACQYSAVLASAPCWCSIDREGEGCVGGRIGCGM